MTYQFDTNIAAVYGVEEAIIIQNLAWWIFHNQANGKYFYEGRYWTFNSAASYAEIFPFWSAGQVRRILKSLETKGVVITGNYNTSAYDHTTWYAFSDSFLEKGYFDLLKSNISSKQKQQIDFSISTNRSNETAKSNIDNNRDSNRDINIDSNIDIDSKDKDTIILPLSNSPSFININNEKEKDYAERETVFTPAQVVANPRSRGRKEVPPHHFEQDPFYNFDLFVQQFAGQEFAGVDLRYYYNSAADWSASKTANKKSDWIATVRNWIRRDLSEGKVRRIQPSGGGLDEGAINYLNMLANL